MEYQALYRQFRPSNFDEIVEQRAAVATLRKTVLTGKIGHAYLFCGQRGTGKTSIARVFARAINCEHPVNGNPCNECAICKGILDGSLMDVIEIDAASNRSIDNIRSICEEVSYAPSRAKYKVYIIDEVHMITTDAFNALLKTLEEPPAHAVFLFATTEPHQIPATILSRCQRFEFRRISVAAIKGRLKYICEKENINCGEDALELIASMSDGAMRDAISYLDQAAAMASGSLITPEAIEDMTGSVNIDFIADFATILINGQYDKLPVKCKELSDSGRDFIQFTLDLAEYFRNLLIVRVVPDPVKLIPASVKTLKRMYEIANLTNSQTLVAFIASFSKTVSELKWSPSVRTSFEISMLRLCGRKIKAEETPLVIPDFTNLQKEAAKRISEGTVSDEKPEPSPVPAIARMPEPEVKPEPAPVPAIARMPEPEVKPEPEAPEKPEVSKEPEPSNEPEPAKEPEPAEAPAEEPSEEPDIESPFDEEETPSLEQIQAKFDELKANHAGHFGNESIETAVPAPEDDYADDAMIPGAVAGPSDAPYEEEDEDKPLENQIGLFFNEEERTETPKVGIFADLSDSVLDDIAKEDEEEEEEAPAEDVYEEDEDLQAPTGRIGETRRSALSTAVESSPIVTAKTPKEETDPKKIWLEIKSVVFEQDRAMGQFLDASGLKLLGEGAFIIIASNDGNEAKAIGADPRFMQVSSYIKSRYANINRVYSCTAVQFNNVIKLYQRQHPGEPVPVIECDDAASDPAADFINSLGQAGLNTEIHFGDE